MLDVGDDPALGERRILDQSFYRENRPARNVG
jgi:hypothetical protein